MDVRLLGPVEAWAGGRRLPLGPRQQRLILAVLALEANRQVTVDRLVDLAWPVDPPRTAAHAVRVNVSKVRAVLAATGTDAAIGTRGSGYVLSIDPAQVDVHRFHALLERARAAPDDQRQVALLDEALALWSGEPLTGTVSAEIRDRLCGGLLEARLTAVEDRADAALRLGRHVELVAELTGLVHDQPLRERLVGQLMTALHRAGRTSTALAVYRTTSERLAEEFGLDPGAELRRLELSILRDDPASDRPTASASPPPATGRSEDRPEVRPRQLPAAATGFAGRDAELHRLDALLRDEPTGVTIVAIAGAAGVGKTALAVQWAHRVRDRFPDGQLHVNLCGYATTAPLRPEQVLARFLRALGVTAERVPTDPAEAAAVYRSLVADRRMLVLLDDAAGSEQVRPLLPAGAGSLVLVTSRDRLGGLVAGDGAHQVDLDVLTAPGARDLLVRMLGARRVDAEPDPADELARLCGYLPLALRIAAANLLAGADPGLAGYVTELRDGDRLGVLEIDGDDRSSVAGAFSLSYGRLPPPERRLFRLLGVLPGTDFGVPAAAAALGAAPDLVRRMLARLTAANMVERAAPGRFTLHDLMGSYARSLAAAEDGPDVLGGAIDRLGAFTLRHVDAAATLLCPDTVRPLRPAPAGDHAPREVFTGHVEAGNWLDDERANLVALVRYLAEHGPRVTASALAEALRGYFKLRRYTDEWLAVATAGLHAADGDPQALAASHLSFGVLYSTRGDVDRTIDHLGTALALATDAGWEDGRSCALNNLGWAYLNAGRLVQAVRHLHQAVSSCRRTGRLIGQAISLDNEGIVYRRLGRLTTAGTLHRRALLLYRATGSPVAPATALLNLGDTCLDLGLVDDALQHYHQAQELHRQTGNREQEATCLYGLAAAHSAAGRHDEAVALAVEAVAHARRHGDQRAEANATTGLGTVYRRLGLHDEAVEAYEQGLALSRRAGDPFGRADALVGLAGARLGRAEPAAAESAVTEALGVIRAARFRLLEADALTVRAGIGIAVGRPDRADGAARAAQSIRVRSGYRLDRFGPPPMPR